MTPLAALQAGGGPGAEALHLPVLELSVHYPSVLLWGFVATLLLSGLMYVGQETGFSRMGIPFLLGTMFTKRRRRAKVAGLLLHMASGMVFALGYALIFQSLGRASWWLGTLAGIVHGFLLLTLGMMLLPILHPRVAGERDGPSPTRWLQPPGFLAMNYGTRTPMVAILAHAIYGFILGTGYQLV